MKKAIVDPTIKALSESIFNDVAKFLSNSGFELSFARPIAGPGKERFNKCTEFRHASPLAKVFDSKSKLLVVWWSKASRNLVKDFGVPIILLYQGILPDSWLADGGLMGDSVLTRMLPKGLDECMGDKHQAWAKNYAKIMIGKNNSKRKQSSARPALPDKFVFLPLQYTEDVSIKEYCSIDYGVFFMKLVRFCSSENISLVVKLHPNIINNPKASKWKRVEIKKVNGLIKKGRKFGCKIAVLDGSIHWFCQNCIFMAGMNTSCHIDAIMNHTISFHTGQSVFMHSKAVVHDDNIERGLKKCLAMNSEEKNKLKKYQRAMLYYLYNRYSILKPEHDIYSSEHGNVQKIQTIFNFLKG